MASYYLQLTAHCPLPTAHCSLLIAHHYHCTPLLTTITAHHCSTPYSPHYSTRCSTPYSPLLYSLPACGVEQHVGGLEVPVHGVLLLV
jgi:hypothetical protein